MEDDVKFFRLPPASGKQRRIIHAALYEYIGRRRTNSDMPYDERRKKKAEADCAKRYDNRLLRSMANTFMGMDDESEDSVC